MDSVALSGRVPAERPLAATVGFPAGYGYLAAALVVIAAAEMPLLSLNHAVYAALAVTAAGLACFVGARRIVNGRLVLEPPLVLASIFVLWHFSYWIVYALHASSWYRYAEYTQFSARSTVLAVYLCAAGFLALLAGLTAGTGRSSYLPVRSVSSTGVARVAAGVGVLLVVAYFAFVGHRLVGHYAAVFLDSDPWRRLYNLGVLLVLASLAPLLSVERFGSRRIALLVGAAAPTVLVAVLLGSRWVLFSAVILACTARSMRGERVGILRVAAFLFLLTVIAILAKTLRADPAALADWRTLLLHRYTNPAVEVFEEVGQAFIAVSGAIDLTQTHGQLHGASFGGAALTVVPSLPGILGVHVARPAHELAATYFGAEYRNSGFTIGFSIVAELYRNFGPAGVIPGLWLLGYGFGRMYRRYLRSHRYAHLFMTYAALSIVMFGMRNDVFTWLRDAVWATIILAYVGRRLDARTQGRSAEAAA